MMRSWSYSRYRRTAAPIASGSPASQAVSAQVSTSEAASAMPARAITAAGTISAAANATQRSCWRSTPLARRKRTTSDPAQTATVRVVNASASWLTTSSTPPRPRKSNGPASTCR